MHEKELVSIITPCYNSTKFIYRLLDSVLGQDYPSIEMLLIDDGSKDELEKYLYLNKYFRKFEKKKYVLKYFHQKNQGQSAAINLGLKHYEGEYLIWPDSDDYFESSAISTFVKLFHKFGDVGTIRCYSNYFSDENIIFDNYSGEKNTKKEKTYLFYDCLFNTENMFFGAGNYMVKKKYLLNSMKKLEIYQHRLTGQNWQLLLPILYNYECFTIQQRLHNIYIRENSHSRSKFSTFKQLSILEQHKKTIIATLGNINTVDETESRALIRKIKRLYSIKKMMLVIRTLLEALRQNKWKK